MSKERKLQAGAISGSHIHEQAEKEFIEHRKKWMRDMIEELCKRLFPELDHIEWKEEE